MSGNRAKLSTFDERVDWLVRKQALWYETWRDGSPSMIRVLKKLFMYMQRDGLFSPTTNYLDVKLKKELFSASLCLRAHEKTRRLME